MTIRQTLYTAVSGAALASLCATAAYAQAVDTLRQEVTVTATKKADVENVQDVPIAITAFNDETLEALKVRDLQSLSYSSPNVALEQIGTTRGTANFAIRGLGVNSSIPSIDPAVGVFVDGVYLGVNSGVVFDLFDLDSVELVRGPQGILFGRNTTGGAVLINTGNPTDEFAAKARIAVETPIDDGRGGLNSFIQGVVSGPIVQDKLHGKLGAYYNKDEGYFENLFNGENHGEADTYIVRGALEAFLTPNFTVLGKVEYFDSEGDGPSAQNTNLYDRESFDLSIDEEGNYTSETIFATLRADWDIDLGGGTITSITGYRDSEGTTLGDIDAFPAFLFHSNTEFVQEQISQELRYSGTFGNAEVTTGLYYFDQEYSYTEVRDLPPLSPLTFHGGGAQEHSVLGVFTQVDYNVTDKLTGIFGLRWSQEEKEAGITYIRPRPACSVVSGTCPTSGTNPFIPTEGNGFTSDNTWSNLSPKLGFQYRYTDDTQLYGSYTRGFRSGGYNFRITDAGAFLAQQAQTGAPYFDEEVVDAYELGFKHQSEGGRATLNAAVFFTEIEDMQREVNIASPTAGVAQFILNTANAELYGVEVEGSFALTDTLLLTGNVGMIGTEYTDIQFDLDGDGVITSTDFGLDIPRVPPATYGVGVIHDLDLGANGVITSRVSFQHRDRYAYTDSNRGWINEADQLDANFAWTTPMDGVTLSLYGKNLLDEVTAGGDTQLPFPGPRSTFVSLPYQDQPTLGTFRPLNKGRLVGLELTLEY